MTYNDENECADTGEEEEDKPEPYFERNTPERNAKRLADAAEVEKKNKAERKLRRDKEWAQMTWHGKLKLKLPTADGNPYIMTDADLTKERKLKLKVFGDIDEELDKEPEFEKLLRKEAKSHKAQVVDTCRYVATGKADETYFKAIREKGLPAAYRERSRATLKVVVNGRTEPDWFLNFKDATPWQSLHARMMHQCWMTKKEREEERYKKMAKEDEEVTEEA